MKVSGGMASSRKWSRLQCIALGAPLAALSLATTAGCGSGDDTIVTLDSGSDASVTPDTGTSDAGSTSDATTDQDAGSTTDAASGSDTGSTHDATAGGDGSAAGDASDSGGGDGGGIIVTSPSFAQGMAIPDMFTCAGVDTSPEIDWTAGPAGTLSYALVVSDTTVTANIHWVVWDIPTTTLHLPADLPSDPVLTTPVSAKQVDLRTSPDAGTEMNGYFGPCPRGAPHGYEFAVHAMNVATLAGVTTMSTSAAVKAAVIAATLAEGTLDGTSSANVPATDAGADGAAPTDAGLTDAADASGE
jgi:Raf kinase inhibitor-like YbhB/YbcL family protein